MMEKPVEEKKGNQPKIVKTPLQHKEENQTKIIAKTESLDVAANAKVSPLILLPPVEQQKGEDQTNESEVANNEKSRPPIWDCGSSLYDSFELKSFERQLDSAIHSRTLSMPHLSDRRVINTSNHHDPLLFQTQPTSKKSSKITRSFHRLLRSVFKPKAQNGGKNQFFTAKDQQAAAQDGFYVVYDRSGNLSTIPEAPEFDGFSPEITSLVRRTASDRFAVTSIGISCA